VSDVHTQLGVLAVGLNAAAAVIGALAWLLKANPRIFWIVLRGGQLLVMVEAVIGAVLLLDGRDLPRLHLVYGLTPIAIAFLGEQLKLLATQTLLDKHGYEGGKDVAKLPAPEQRAFVTAVLRREVGVMATAAFVVAVLAARAQLWI
jgi:hypothetical protein